MSEINIQAPQNKTWQDPFVSWLESLRRRDDGDARKQLAAMRRWLAPSLRSQVEAAQAVQPHLSMNASRAREGATYLVGALFGLHDKEGGSGNMGNHFRELCDGADDPPPNVERRFMTLLAADGPELDNALRQAVMLLKSKGVAVDWHRLIGDVQKLKSGISEAQDRVRQEWSKQFWRKRVQQKVDGSETNDSSAESEANSLD